MRLLLARLLPIALLALVASRAHAGPWDVSLGGLAMPQVKWEQSDPNPNIISPKQSGFTLRRARIIAQGWYRGQKLTWEGRIEAEMIPGWQLLDAYLAAGSELRGGGYWRIALGQQWTPFSRQSNTLVGDLQMVEYARLIDLVPQRQLGLSASLGIPYAPWLQLWFGVFNGKGINIIENLDTNFMYVGRIAFRPIGPRVPIIEGALGPNALWIATNALYNKKNLGSYEETQVLVGADLFASFYGASVYFEFLWGQYTYTAGAPKQNYDQLGLNLQLGYLLPIPGRVYRRFELTFRFEATAPNRTVPITGPGDPTQGRGSFVGGLNYYHRGHDLKLQLNYYHNFELDREDPAGNPATYANDSLILQLVYRLK